ncbi:MAG: radical SAM protein [Candidatus Omnitrophota bacterium]|jgi:anaerobic magnesium-protoporphyrin IX monomethyl ester cyclase|nr:MAG: radical SAM protein [Candidatus Omnitrophota bacterium]
MNLILVNPYSHSISGVNKATIEPPVGLAYIAALLESRGYNCQIIDAQIMGLSSHELLREIRIQPDLIGISSSIVTYPAALDTAKVLKEAFKGTPVIFGGPHPSSIPEKALQNDCVDAVAVGEAEATMLEIARRFKDGEHLFSGIEGVIYKNNGEVVTNSPRKLIEDLDALPFPAYHLLPGFKLYKSRARKSPVAPLLTNRGCPYQCTFCNKDIFQRRIRSRSPENVIKEIDWLVNKFSVKQIDILDDNFNFDLNHAKQILDLIIDRDYSLAINMQNGIRADNVDPQLLDKMKKAGVFKIGFGIETADPQVQRKIKKVLDLDKIIGITRQAQEKGIIVYANFIIGLVGDSQESMQRTIDYAVRLSPDIANFMIALPLPGTELYKEIEEKGKFLVNVDGGVEKGFYGNQVFYEIGSLNKDMVLKYYRKAYRDFYIRPGRWARLIRSIRSVNELIWFKDAIFDLIKNMLIRNR